MEIIINNRFKVLKPSRGMVLTQAEIDNEEERTLASEICMPLDSDVLAWTEWTEDQKREWEAKYKEQDDDIV